MVFSFRMLRLNGLLLMVVPRKRRMKKMRVRRKVMKKRMRRVWSHLMKETKIFQVRIWSIR